MFYELALILIYISGDVALRNFETASTIQGKNLFPEEQILFFKNCPLGPTGSVCVGWGGGGGGVGGKK